jgi:hypothetical protein
LPILNKEIGVSSGGGVVEREGFLPSFPPRGIFPYIYIYIYIYIYEKNKEEILKYRRERYRTIHKEGFKC